VIKRETGVYLIEICFLKHLPPCLSIYRQHADSITQEIEDEAKMLRIPVNENTPLQKSVMMTLISTKSAWVLANVLRRT